MIRDDGTSFSLISIVFTVEENQKGNTKLHLLGQESVGWSLVGFRLSKSQLLKLQFLHIIFSIVCCAAVRLIRPNFRLHGKDPSYEFAELNQ